ncbi:hypothetical protein FCM35_KLT15310 [Carex littledalei]|uniref:Uncharacterized protein n=1 Tax=Carex littledalei TaxID=544730 RepID=A0A833W0W0_9POAL|nr:hypothetical protein FCM35_KLT15310 [Carex littledalei]
MGSPQADAPATQCRGGKRRAARGVSGRADGIIRVEPGLGPPAQPASVRAPRRQARWSAGAEPTESDRGASPAPIRFPPGNFKHSLTLFSKSFSSFPRGTCSLSVSRRRRAAQAAAACSSLGGQTRPRVGTELGATCAVAHHSPLPATHDGRTLGPTAPRGSEGQCPHLFALRQPSVDGLLTPVRQACPREGPSGATCVQRLDGSRDSAIHTTYRISLRSKSMREPRYPLPRVILFFVGLSNRRRHGAARRCLSSFSCSLASSRAVFRPATDAPEGEREEAGGGRGGGERLPGSILSRVQRSCFSRGNGNDPSAGRSTTHQHKDFANIPAARTTKKCQKGQQISPRDDFATRDRVEPHRQPITRIPTTTHSVTGGTVKRQPHVRLAAPKVQGARHAEQVQNNSYDATVLDTLHQRPQHRRPSQNDLETTDVQTPRSIPFLPGVSALDAPLACFAGASPRLDAPLHRVSPRFARGVSTLRRPASVFCRDVSTLRRPAQTRLCGASPRLDAPLNPLLRGASPRLDAPLACFAGTSPRLDAPLKHGCAGRLHA